MSKDDNSNILLDLATLTGAGIAMLEAVKIVASSYPKVTIWLDVIDRVAKGEALSYILKDCGLISRYEQEVIATAEFSGKIEPALMWLGLSYEKRSRRVNQLKYKLILPFVVLIIGVIASSILTMIKSSEASVFSVLGQAVLILICAVVFTKIVLYLLQKEPSLFIANSGIFHHLNLYKYLFEQVFFGALLWNIKSGIDFKTGFIRISKIIKAKSLTQKFVNVSRYCGQGMSVVESIKKEKLPITAEFVQVLNVAERSGSWEQAVEHYLQKQQEMLDLKIDTILEWLPRIYYVLVVVFVSSIIY